MELIRKIFHWILVAIFVMMSVIGFAGGSITIGVLNVLLVLIVLPFGILYELTGMRRLAKWLAVFVLVIICVASLPG